MASEVDERRVTAWIGQGVVVDGRITSAQDLRIDGKVDGTIEVGNHGLIIGASAIVKANLVARSIVISGAVNGNVTASERVDLHVAHQPDVEAQIVSQPAQQRHRHVRVRVDQPRHVTLGERPPGDLVHAGCSKRHRSEA